MQRLLPLMLAWRACVTASALCGSGASARVQLWLPLAVVLTLWLPASAQGARRMLEQMSRAGVPPSEQTYAYNSLLGAYARRGFSFRQATFDLLDEMSDSGIVESSTFNTLMDAAVECDDPEVCWLLPCYPKLADVRH